MSNIKNFKEYLLENSSNKTITVSNFLELKDKILAIITTEENTELRKAYDFTISNISDYNSDDFVRELINPFLEKINILINKYPQFWKNDDKGYSGYKSFGKNYHLTKDMDIKEISKLIKEELDIEFPQWKFSSKISRYSGGQSINVTIVDIPYSPYSEEVDYSYKNNTEYTLNRRDGIYNEQYLKDYDKIEQIIKQYNYDDSDGQIDYFAKKYYSHIYLDDMNTKRKFYPDNLELKKSEERSKEWDEKSKKRNEIAATNRGKFKKGENIIFIYDKESTRIPKGEYKGIVLKSPNGRALMSKYEIKFFVNKTFKDGVIIETEKSTVYNTFLYGDSKLKKDEV